MPHPEMANGVASLLRDPAESAIQVTDEGIFPMKTHRRVRYVAMHARTVPVEGLPETPRTDPMVRATRGILILALALGGLGADAAASSGHGSADHAVSHQPAGNIHLTASTHAASKPWIY
jgi:hypothetical protein